MHGPHFFPPDAANSADIQQASNAIALEGTREDNRLFGSGTLFLNYFQTAISQKL